MTRYRITLTKYLRLIVSCYIITIFGIDNQLEQLLILLSITCRSSITIFSITIGPQFLPPNEEEINVGSK